jgi:hypothetical protein
MEERPIHSVKPRTDKLAFDSLTMKACEGSYSLKPVKDTGPFSEFLLLLG